MEFLINGTGVYEVLKRSEEIWVSDSEPHTYLLYMTEVRRTEARKPKISAESWAKSPFRWASQHDIIPL